MTSEPMLSVLLVEDNLADARLLEIVLRDSNMTWCELVHVETMAAAIERVRAGGIDAVLLDLSLPDGHGTETVTRMRAVAPSVPVVVLTGLDDEQTALRAVKEGAQDYLVKSEVTGSLLVRAVRYAIERKRADEATRREGAAAQTAQLREQFVAVLGHDLRNPLSSIAMGAGLLLKNGDLSERHLKVIARIASSADRMTRMIRDLLDFTRTRMGGGYELARVPCGIRDIVQQVIEELEIVHKSRTLIFKADDRGWGDWDPDRIAQLASNLIGNGLEYSPAHEPVLIEVREDGPDILLEINNRGETIPAALLPVLFDPFYRVKIKREGTSAQGLGLGLYISNQIVIAHRGRIEVRSDDAGGTTFSVRLPRTTPPKSDARPTSPPTSEQTSAQGAPGSSAPAIP